MADPLIVECTKDIWTKVATNVTSGIIWIKNKLPTYLQTYRDTGESAPTNKDDAIPIYGNSIPISASAGIDVYIQPVAKDGVVRVDV